MAPVLDSSVSCKAFRVSIAGNKAATVYVNFYLLKGGSTVQYRATIQSINLEWTEYTIGFGSSIIECVSGGQGTMKPSDLQYLSRVSFGVVMWDGSYYGVNSIYVDNFLFDGTANSLAVNTRTVIA